jgi:hypothetical protein
VVTLRGAIIRFNCVKELYERDDDFSELWDNCCSENLSLMTFTIMMGSWWEIINFAFIVFHYKRKSFMICIEEAWLVTWDEKKKNYWYCLRHVIDLYRFIRWRWLWIHQLC